MDSQGVNLSRIFLEFFLKPVYPTIITENGPFGEGKGDQRSHGTPLFLNRTLLSGMFSWKFAFVSFSKACKTFLVPALSAFCQRPQKSFKVLVVRLLEDKCLSQRKESFYFCSFPRAKHYLRQKEITHFTLTAFSENLLFPSRKGEDYGAKKMTKIKLVRVLVINCDKSHHLCNLLQYF